LLVLYIHTNCGILVVMIKSNNQRRKTRMVRLDAMIQPELKRQLEKFSERKGIALADGLRRLLETHPELHTKKTPSS
jgi:hypothetical protein